MLRRSLVVVVAVALPLTASAGGGGPAEGLRLAERSADRLRWTVSDGERRVEVRTDRRLIARIQVPLPEGATADFDAETPFGIRIDGRTLTGTLGTDPKWREGRRSARIDLGADGARALLRWRGGTLRAKVVARGESPVAEGLRGEPEGDAQAPLEAAMRLGDERFRFAGTARGSVAREVVRVLDAPVDLVRVRVGGKAGLAAPEDDRSPPAVTLSTPAAEAIVPPDAVSVSGTLRDDFTLVRLAYSVDGGPEQDAPFSTDAATGYLDDLLGSFSFPVSTGEGAHSVEVRAYDAAGNVASATVGFIAAEQRLVPLAAGLQSTAAVDAAGDVRLWGWHTLFAGEGNPMSRATVPTKMPGFEGSVAVAVEMYHLLALRADGTVRAAGYNGTGILGLGHTDPVEGVVTVPGLTGVVSLCAGFDFAAALRADGSVWTWGLNTYGQLWTGDGMARSAPTPAPAVPPMRAIFAGPYALYGVAEDGSLWGRAPYPSEVIERIEGPEDVVSVAIGGALVIVERSGRVWTQGLNNRGQCGRGVYGYSLALGLVPGVTDAVSAAAGGLHSMLLRADGTVLVVGTDSDGQHGDGLPTSSEWTLSFAPVPGLDQVQQIVAADDRSFAVRRDGGIFAWGSGGNGEIGDGSTGYRPEPVPIHLGE